MVVYYIIFLIAFFCSYISEIFFNKNHRFLYILFKGLSILFPSFLAAFRSVNVGTDTAYYVLENYLLSLNSSSVSDFLKVGYGEPLYLFITYVTTILFENIHFTFFVIQIIIQLFIYNCCERYSNNNSISTSISYIIYLLLFYNKSLNMIRQSVALSITLYNFVNIKNRNKFKYLFWCFVASLFHITSLLTMLFYPLYILLESKDKTIKKFIIVFCSIISFLSFDKFVNLLIYNLGILDVKYSYYLQGGNSQVSTTFILLYSIFLVLLLFFNKKISQQDKFNNYLVFICFLGIIVILLGLRFNYVERLSYYFSYTLILLLPQIIDLFKKGKDRGMICFCLFIVLFSFNFLYYGIQGNDGTNNYEFSIEKYY